MSLSWRTLLAGAACAGLPLLAAAADGCHYTKLAELTVRLVGPELQPALDGSLDGQPNLMLLDTGANATMLTRSIAEAHGYTLQPTGGYTRGIGGSGILYAIKAKEFGIGPSQAKNVPMLVAADAPGLKAYGGLVGSDVLLRQDMELALADGKLRFFRDENCKDTALSYWSPEALEVPMYRPTSTAAPRVDVVLNGKRITAVIDTGATRSAVYRDTAEQLGVTLDPSRKRAPVSGLGGELVQRWGAAFQFQLAEETIKDAQLDILDRSSMGHLSTDGMILGQDWLRAHRVLFAVSQSKLYFSYLGTPLFE